MKSVGGYGVAEKYSLAILKCYEFLFLGLWRAIYRFPLRMRIDNQRLSDRLPCESCFCRSSVCLCCISGLCEFSLVLVVT